MKQTGIHGSQSKIIFENRKRGGEFIRAGAVIKINTVNMMARNINIKGLFQQRELSRDSILPSIRAFFIFLLFVRIGNH